MQPRPRMYALFGLLHLFTVGQCFIIPDEVPSLLSLVYSNIPPIKKGTDSRVGFGFRLGPHADFQVLLELGPQTNTDPIGGAEEEPPAKRDTLIINNPYSLMDYLRGNRGTTEATPPEEVAVADEANKGSDAGNWLSWWRENIFPAGGGGPVGKIQFKKVPGIDDLRKSADVAAENAVLDFRDPTREGGQGFVDQLRKLYERRKRVLAR